MVYEYNKDRHIWWMCSPRGPGCMLDHAARDSKISQVRHKFNCPSPQALSRHDFIILLDGISLQFDPAIY